MESAGCYSAEEVARTSDVFGVARLGNASSQPIFLAVHVRREIRFFAEGGVKRAVALDAAGRQRPPPSPSQWYASECRTSRLQFSLLANAMFRIVWRVGCSFDGCVGFSDVFWSSVVDRTRCFQCVEEWSAPTQQEPCFAVAVNFFQLEQFKQEFVHSLTKFVA